MYDIYVVYIIRVKSIQTYINFVSAECDFKAIAE